MDGAPGPNVSTRVADVIVPQRFAGYGQQITAKKSRIIRAVMGMHAGRKSVGTHRSRKKIK